MWALSICMYVLSKSLIKLKIEILSEAKQHLIYSESNYWETKIHRKKQHTHVILLGGHIMSAVRLAKSEGKII